MALTFRPEPVRPTFSPPSAAGAGPQGYPAITVPLWLRALVAVFVLCFILGYLPGRAGAAFSLLQWIALVAALIAVIPAAYSAAQQGLLWRLRNKLLLTYLLIGLAPLILVSTLVLLSTYVAAGQFSIHLAASRLEAEMDQLGRENNAAARHLAYLLSSGSDPAKIHLADIVERNPVAIDRASRDLGLQTAVFRDGAALPIEGLTGHVRSPLRLTDAWRSAKGEQLRTLAIWDDRLYVVAADRQLDRAGHSILLLTSRPVNRKLADTLAESLGSVILLPGLAGQGRPLSPASKGLSDTLIRRGEIDGGHKAKRANLLDVEVRFLSTLPVLLWETGQLYTMPINVESRPSVLFEELFGSGLTGRISDTVRAAFLTVCLLFALLELLALWMAMRLSRTVTQSVEDLYAATRHIDSGNLQHRIFVSRTDQLADLCRSFNRMSWSLGRLIDEQKEKERMQNELTIAQEVQANLFPLADIDVPSLELHGVCRPARTVSGDYYDFLPFRSKNGGMPVNTGVGLALGDISGKGISAALLMATLHSAVRAYRFASEELLSPAAVRSSGGESIECNELFESPGHILALLNRHLFRTTQPEKYATLFLAHYDCRSSRLIYSNAGQLPPFILCVDGSLRRLDKGGTVVGLLDGMTYAEESVRLSCGDILIAYSDGVTEPENDFGDFGEDRLIEVVRQFRDESLDRISSEVLRALDAWIGEGEQPDDITLVLARQT